MKCTNHPLIEAVGVCSGCGQGLCAECAVEIRGRPWCRRCLESLVERSSISHVPALAWPSRLVAGLLSMIPGAGHMYLGLIGKGFAIMGLLIASIFLIVLYSEATGMYWVTAYLVPTISVLLLSYAVFDTLALAGAMRAGRKPASDPTMDAITERVLLNRRTAAYLILIAGIVGVLELFEQAIGSLIRTYLGMNVPATALVVPVVLVIIGARMLWKGRRSRGA